MKKTYAIFGLIFFVLFACSAQKAREEKKLTSQQLFKNTCTQCHDQERAKNIHGTQEEFKEIVKKMQQKEGSDISDEDVAKIAGFLGNPNRTLFETKCTKCHSLERIEKAHLSGKTAQEIIERMSKKEGAQISEEEKDSIYEYLNDYYFVPPMPPVAPVPPIPAT